MFLERSATGGGHGQATELGTTPLSPSLKPLASVTLDSALLEGVKSFWGA